MKRLTQFLWMLVTLGLALYTSLTLWLAFAGVMVKVKLYGGVSRRLDESVMSTVAVAFGLSARTVIFGKDTEMGFAALGLS